MTDELITTKIFSSDLKPLKHAVLFKNDTSGTSVSDPSKILLREFLPTGFVIEMPIHSCKKGHLVTLFILEEPVNVKFSSSFDSETVHKKVKNAIEVVGKIEDVVTNDDPQRENVTVHFNQYDEVRWKELVDTYIRIQEAMNEFMEQKKL